MFGKGFITRLTNYLPQAFGIGSLPECGQAGFLFDKRNEHKKIYRRFSSTENKGYAKPQIPKNNQFVLS